MSESIANHEPVEETVATITSTVVTHPVAPAEETLAGDGQTATTTIVEKSDAGCPTATHAESNLSTVNESQQTQDENESETKDKVVPVITAGMMAYRIAHATLPIYRKRHFFFKDGHTPLESLHTFYNKLLKNRTMEKTELHELIAYASVSGKGLLFWSKEVDTVPTGIITCSNFTEILADEKHPDRFHVSCKDNSTYVFETKEIERDEWIKAILLSRGEAEAEYAHITTSAAYLATLKALNDGVAYSKVSAEAPTDVSSDEGATGTAMETESKIGQTKPKRSSAFFSAFKDKGQQDNAV